MVIDVLAYNAILGLFGAVPADNFELLSPLLS